MTTRRNICLICGAHYYGDLDDGEVSLYCESSEILPAEKAGKDGKSEKPMS